MKTSNRKLSSLPISPMSTSPHTRSLHGSMVMQTPICFLSTSLPISPQTQGRQRSTVSTFPPSRLPTFPPSRLPAYILKPRVFLDTQLRGVHSVGCLWGATGSELQGGGGSLCGAGGTLQHATAASAGPHSHVRGVGRPHHTTTSVVVTHWLSRMLSAAGFYEGREKAAKLAHSRFRGRARRERC